MTEEQADSVLMSLYKNGKLVFFTDIDSDYATFHDPESFTFSSSCYRLYNNGKQYYISMHPKYIDGRLSGLFCTIQNKSGQDIDKPIYKVFSDLFEESDRGKNFHKYTPTVHNADGDVIDSGMIIFIKDNLKILFYPQPNSDEGTIQYVNVPDEEKINEARKKPEDEL